VAANLRIQADTW